MTVQGKRYLMKLDFQVPSLPMSESQSVTSLLSELRFGGADPCIRTLIATVSYAVNVTPFFTQIQAAQICAFKNCYKFLRSRNCFWFLGHVSQVHLAVLLGNDDAHAFKSPRQSPQWKNAKTSQGARFFTTTRFCKNWM